MAAIKTVDVYRRLEKRLDRFPQRAPASPLLDKILRILFTPEEARLTAQLPILPFDAGRAAGIWKVSEIEARRTLDTLAARGILLDILPESGPRQYVLPPPMAGFFEFALMRVRSDIDQKALSALFYAYINVEEEFVQDLFLAGPTSIARVFVHEPSLPAEPKTEILSYERAGEVVETASAIAVGECYCRHKMALVGRGCPAPVTICLTFGNIAASLSRNGHARAIDKVEGNDLLQQAYAHNLVQGGENVQNQVGFICNCCTCCCEGLIAVRKYGARRPIHPANFLPRIDSEDCTGCGICEHLCPAAAIGLQGAEANGNSSRAVVDESVCIGCGICARNCPASAIRMERRLRGPVTPVDTVHRTVLMAVERGKLQNLIFDNQALFSHRMLAAFLGAVLRLPPLKRIMVNRQLPSVYLEKLLSWRGDPFAKSRQKATALQ